MSSSPDPSTTPGALPWDDPGFELDPYPWYERVQAHTPVYWDPLGFYVVTKYDDVMTYGKHRAMSVEPGWDSAGPWKIARNTIIGRDDPDHMRLRRLTNKWFTPKMVREWVTTAVQATNDVLDTTDGHTVDGWHDLAVIPTHRTMCRVLQFPDHEYALVKKLMGQTMPMLGAIPRAGTRDTAGAAFGAVAEHVNQLLADKRAHPGDGLADALLAAADRGEMSDEEMLATVLIFYGLGHLDVGYVIASGLHVFATKPDVYQAFREESSIRDAVVNEIIRYDPPELSFYRTTLEDITIRGVDIAAGSTIRFMIGAANRDPDYFDQPQVFDIHRPPEHSRNLSFGLGPHSCAGQVISRAETLAVLSTIADRYREIELAEPVAMDNTDFSRHFTRLALRLIP